MLGAKEATLGLKGLSCQFFGLRIARLLKENFSYATHRFQRVGIFWSEDLAPHVQSLSQDRVGPRIQPQVSVNLSHHNHHLGSQFRIPRHPTADVCRSLIEDFAGGNGVAPRFARI